MSKQWLCAVAGPWLMIRVTWLLFRSVRLQKEKCVIHVFIHGGHLNLDSITQTFLCLLLLVSSKLQYIHIVLFTYMFTLSGLQIYWLPCLNTHYYFFHYVFSEMSIEHHVNCFSLLVCHSTQWYEALICLTMKEEDNLYQQTVSPTQTVLLGKFTGLVWQAKQSLQ